MKPDRAWVFASSSPIHATRSLGLKERGLHGVEFVVADDHAGLKAALREVLP